MSYGLNLGWGGPIGDYIGFWGGSIKEYTTNAIQGLYELQPKLLKEDYRGEHIWDCYRSYYGGY